MPTSSLQTVHDDDLLALLEKLDLADAFESGELSCHFCDDTITWGNLHALYPEGGRIFVVCDKRSCVHSMAHKLDENLKVR